MVAHQGLIKDTMANINKDLGRISDATAIEAGYNAAKGKKRGNGLKIRDVMVEQSKLPQGKTRFRILPGTGTLTLPWVRFDEHRIGNETAIETEWKFTSFNCPDKMGRGPCVACLRFLPRLENSPIPGAKKMADKGFPKTQLVANVEFTLWGGGPVPADKQGIRPFKFGRGIWRGGDKNKVGGLMELLQEQPNLASIEDGCEIEVTKEGVELDTTYAVQLVKTRGKVEIAPGKSIEMDIPAFSPLGKDDDEIERKLNDRIDLTIFLRMLTDDEMLDKISKVDPLPEDTYVRDLGPQPGQTNSRALPAGKPTTTPRSGQFQGHTPRDFRTVQDEIEGDADGFDSKA